MRNWLQSNALTIIPVLGTALLVALGFLAFLFYVIQYRLPDFDNELSNFRSEQKEFISDSKALINKTIEKNAKELSDISRKQEDRLEKAEGNISKIRISLISLMNKIGKAPTKNELNELLSSAEEYSAIKATDFKEVKLSSESDQLPNIGKFQGWAGVALNLGLDIPNEEISRGTSDQKNIKSVMTRSLLSKDTKWEVNDMRLTVKYDSGTILFIPHSNISVPELQRMADELNEIKSNISILPQESEKTWIKSNENLKQQ